MTGRWWWPRNGEGSRTWAYLCPHTYRHHACTHPVGHGWQHTAPSGFRWAA